MWIIPAIDILDGCCVRLRGGDYNAATVYEKNPTTVAEKFFAAGVTRLHVVDLDAAKRGKPVNTVAIEAILNVAHRYNAVVEVGGGLRTVSAVQEILSTGATFAIIGTAAVLDADFRHRVITDNPNQIIVGMDTRDGKVAVDGWYQDSTIDESDFLNDLATCPPAAIIYTDIYRDGMLSGVNLAATAHIAERAPCPVIASGGVSSVDDLRRVASNHTIAGIIIGQALYTGSVTLTDALSFAV